MAVHTKTTVASGRRWLSAAFLVTLVTSALFLVLPVYSTTTSTEAGSTTGSRSLLDVEGPRVVLILLVPVVFSAVPLMAGPRWRRRAAWICAALLALAALASLPSVGLAYLPAVALLAVGASRTPQT